jgi:hypothetical protein
MMKGRKTGGRNFLPGQSGNPKGASGHGVSVARRINAREVTKIISRLMRMSVLELTTFSSEPTITVVEGILAKIMIAAGQTGDHNRLNFLFDRMIGKVTDKLEVESPPLVAVKYFDEPGGVMMGLESDDGGGQIDGDDESDQ